MTSADTCTGNIVCFFRQVLSDENLITRLYHTGIIHIHILYEEPGTDTVIRQFTSLFHKLHRVVIQQQTGLVLRICGTIENTASPQVAVRIVLYFKQSVVQHLCLHIGL